MIKFFITFTANIKKNFYICFFTILLCSTIYAKAENSNKIGIITEITGNFKALQNISSSGKVTNEPIKNGGSLSIYDEIYRGVEYELAEKSSVTLSIDDKSMIRLKGPSKFRTTDFNLEKKSETFIFEVRGGQFAIESGEISKANGNMIMKLKDSEVKFKGTLVSGNISEGQSNIFLSEDNFGNLGSVSINSAGKTQNIDKPNQGLAISSQGFQNKTMPESSKQEVQAFKTSVVQSSKIDEKNLTAQLQKKLDNGTLKDSNNDGKVDAADIKAQSDSIKIGKISRIDFIINNTNPEQKNTLLAEVLEKSDAQNVGEVMTKIIETKPEAAATVVSTLSESKNPFITNNTNPALVAIKDKVMEQIISQGNEKSIDAISKYIQVTNVETNNKLMNQIVQSAAGEGQSTNIALAVISNIANNNPEKLNEMVKSGAESFQEFSKTAVMGAMTSGNDNAEAANAAIAGIITKTNGDVGAAFMAKITEGAKELASSGTPGANQNTNIALAVISNIANNNPEKLNEIAKKNSDSFQAFTDSAISSNNSKNNESDQQAIVNILSKTGENVAAALQKKIEDEKSRELQKLAAEAAVNTRAPPTPTPKPTPTPTTLTPPPITKTTTTTESPIVTTSVSSGSEYMESVSHTDGATTITTTDSTPDETTTTKDVYATVDNGNGTSTSTTTTITTTTKKILRTSRTNLVRTYTDKIYKDVTTTIVTKTRVKKIYGDGRQEIILGAAVSSTNTVKTFVRNVTRSTTIEGSPVVENLVTTKDDSPGAVVSTFTFDNDVDVSPNVG